MQGLAPCETMVHLGLLITMRHIAVVLKQAAFGEEYVNPGDPSVLRFLIASREEVSAQQLRDDLLSMLVAGHETTGSVLTWTLYLLCRTPSAMQRVRLNPEHQEAVVIFMPGEKHAWFVLTYLTLSIPHSQRRTWCAACPMALSTTHRLR